LKMVLEKVMGN